MKLYSIAFSASLLLLSAGATKAAPVVATLTDFTAAAVVVDFNAIANAAPINTQFAGSGVTFTGALVGLNNSGDTSQFNNTTIASNWIYGSGGGRQGTTWTATFSAVQNIAGFHVLTHWRDPVSIQAFNGATSLGTVNFLNPNGTDVDFIGVRDLLGFDRITVTTSTADNGFFAMDDFRFQQTVNAVPEPGSLALFGMALAGLMTARRRKK